MVEIDVNGSKFEVPEEVAKHIENQTSQLKEVKDWINRLDSLVNGCGIEDEYYELCDIFYKNDSEDGDI